MENDHEMNRYSIRFISTELDKSTPQLEKQTETVAQYKQFYLKLQNKGEISSPICILINGFSISFVP